MNHTHKFFRNFIQLFVVITLLVTPWGGYQGVQASPDESKTETSVVQNLPKSASFVEGAGSNVVISSGNSHTCVITNTGGVKCWGDNSVGQLGDGTTTQRLSPVDVSGLTSGVIAISAGGGVGEMTDIIAHTCALLSTGGVKCWGDNSGGQLGDGTTTQRLTPVNVSGLTSGVLAISAGSSHTCALTTTGGVKCWGVNFQGQLGDNTTTQRAAPVNVSGLTSGVTAISAGAGHTCALTSTGGVKCWGSNVFGQLGNNTTTQRRTPVLVNGLASGVTAISAGGNHTCALTSTGGVKCWGQNSFGQLGDGTTTQRLVSVDVNGLTSGVTAISAGGTHTCALTTTGGVKCWGGNGYGQLGDNTTTQRLTPVDVSGLTSGVTTISSGTFHTCALTSTGGVKCWGDNEYSQIGDGTSTNVSFPTSIQNIFGWVPPTWQSAISAGVNHTCVLTNTGGVQCWGPNTYGQLGNGTTSPQSTLVYVSDLNGVKAVSSGQYHTCVLTETNGVKCWGDNTWGQLGDGSTTNHSLPVDVSNLTSGVVAISAGHKFTCALTSAGAVKCWGNNWFGQLGDGSTTNSSIPVGINTLTSGVKAISAGNTHICALTSTDGVVCWGNNNRGQLGNGSTTNSSIPVGVSNLTSGVKAISARGGVGSGDATSMEASHTCALTSANGVKCWGSNDYGQLGDGSTTNRSTPVEVSGLNSGVTAISTGSFNTCALNSAGGVLCWGYNNHGQVGDGTMVYRTAPVSLSGLTSGVMAVAIGEYYTCAMISLAEVKCWGFNNFGQVGRNTTQYLTPLDVSSLSTEVMVISAGAGFACALTSAGGVKCWGSNDSGQLGDGTTTQRLTPVDVTGLNSGVKAIATGQQHACALTDAGAVKCWGRNDFGQLGDNSTTQRLTPGYVNELTSGVTAISVGGQHTCALTDAGAVKCWGRNDFGQLGDNSTTQRLTPGYVNELTSGVTAISTGLYHTCALTSAGTVKCWGANINGQLGDGATTQRLTPVIVSGLNSDVMAISTGQFHTCAVTDTGEARCWGDNSNGQLGDGTTTRRLTPVTVSGLNSGVTAISSGSSYTCALISSGGVKCWGNNDNGQLGDGTTTQRLAPADVSGLSSGVAAISAVGQGGYSHTCALTTYNAAKCWGNNYYGQMGNDTAIDMLYPTLVPIVVIPVTTKVISADPTTVLDSISTDGTTFIYNQTTPILTNLAVGDVMVSGPVAAAPYGYLRKVTGKSPGTDGKMTVTTAPAALEDAVTQGQFSFNQALQPTSIQVLDPRPGVVVSQASAASACGTDCFSVTLTDVALSADGFEVKASGKIDFKMKPDFFYEIRDGHLDKAHLTFESAVYKTLDLETTISANTPPLPERKIKVPVAMFVLSLIPGAIGPVPVVIVPEVTVNVGLDGKVGVGMEWGVVEQVSRGKVGVEYKYNQPPQFFSNQSDDPITPIIFNNPTPEVFFAAEIKGYTELGPILKLYGLAGPFAYLRYYIKAEAKGAKDNGAFCMFSGLEVPIGFNAGPFNIEGSVEIAETRFYCWTGGTGNVPPNVPSSPVPGDGYIGQRVKPHLAWNGGDPNTNDIVSYDVYLGYINPPILRVALNLSDPSYDPGTLLANTTYYWRVVARDSSGAETNGPIWSFTTGNVSVGVTPTKYIPAGVFIIGNGASDAPQRPVYLSGYSMDITEVTNAQFGEYWRATHSSSATSLADANNQPAVNVRWLDAKNYCQWAGKRLPTEAQWEKAARGSTPGPYPWGTQALTCTLANIHISDPYNPYYCVGHPVDVGSYPSGASPYGIRDMIGNVREWVYDFYDPTYYFSFPTPPSPPIVDPQGGSDAWHTKVTRGGAWDSGSVGVSYRGEFVWDFISGETDYNSYSNLGFRCVTSSGN
jgi:alpha-tubulin suppressor-like RCC1 family protein/formylglycine-generating enzyme required for sulfatase activity